MAEIRVGIEGTANWNVKQQRSRNIEIAGNKTINNRKFRKKENGQKPGCVVR